MNITKIITTEYDVTNVPMLQAGEVCPVVTQMSPKKFVAGSEVLTQLCRVDQFRKELDKVEAGLLAVLGHDEVKSDDEDLTELFKNSYHPGRPVHYEPRSASSAWLEEKLAEAEAITAKKDSQLAAMDKFVQELQDERDKCLTDQGQTTQTYRLRFHHAQQELDHLRNVCAEHEAACRGPMENILAVYEDMANTGPFTDEEFTRRQLNDLGAQLHALLKEAKRD